VPKRVAIVGGGVTGLAAAFDLERLTDAEIDLYEASDRLGGKVGTERIGDLLVEQGPDCFFARKPGVMELVADLGLESELIEPVQKEFSMLVGGQLHRVPGGLVTLTYSEPTAIEEATFLTPEAKARVLAERDQPAGTAPDESIRSFFTRRFGPEFTRLVAEPLLAGTHAGDPDRLSMRALYPGYFNLERKNGSLAGGMGGDKSAGGPENRSGGGSPGADTTPRASFLSFRDGMQTLVDGLHASLRRTRVHVGSEVQIPHADHVLLAVPANRAAALVESQAPEAARLMRAIPHNSSAIVTLAFRRTEIEHPLDGTGFLVPGGEGLTITGATWSSRKWAGRAPADTVLMRVFLGGDRQALVQRPDEDLVKLAVDAITPIMGVKAPPSLVRVGKWIHALPQYEVGHLDRISEIERAMGALPHVTLAGTSFRGVGVPDCLRQGREAAKKIAETL